MAIPSVAGPNARFICCKGANYSWQRQGAFRPAHHLNIQDILLGDGLGFRTFRPMRQVLFTS